MHSSSFALVSFLRLASPAAFLLALSTGAYANPTWRLFSAVKIPFDNTTRFEGEKEHTTDGDLGTAYGVRLVNAVGSVGPEMHFTYLPADGSVRRVQEVRFHMHVERGFVRNSKVLLTIGGLSSIPVAQNATLTDGQVLSWKPPSAIPADRLFVIIDSRSSFRPDTNGINNLIGLKELEVVEEGEPALEVAFGQGSVGTNPQGWPSPNPVSLTLTARCPVESTATCRSDVNLELGSAGGTARFFVADTTFPGTRTGCSSELDDPDLHLSTRSHRTTCPAVELAPGEVLGFNWTLWVQPSDASRLDARAEWLGSTKTDDLPIAAARIHPVVFLHGIQGSQPPADELIVGNDRMLGRLDPFNGYYWPLLYQLQKMGYLWDESLFALAYDWRNSNRISAAWLSSQLKDEILPRSQSIDVKHVNQDGQVDLIVHSMGGLVTRAYLQNEARTKTGVPKAYGGEIRKVVFGATPHKGFPFDYQTWESGNWEDYMDGSPVFPPALMAFTMNQNIWPRYVAKHYRPTSTELDNECYFAPLNSGQLPVGAYVTFDFKGPIPGFRVCNRDVFIRWQHHPDRGVRSLFEMLPTNDTPRYLYDASGTGPGPLPHEENTFLHTINSKIRFDFPNALGNVADHVYVLLGDGAPETDVGYKVEIPSASHPDLWRQGKVLANVDVRDASGNVITGDNLIPSYSACLRCGDSPLLPDLPADNEAILDASPGAPFRARHSPVLQHPETLQNRLPKWLAGYDAGIPFTTDPDPPLLSTSAVLVATNCPVNVLVTDPAGNRVGFEPSTGAVLREIDGAVYTAPGLEPQIVLIPAPLAGTYRVTIKGYGEGPVTVTSDFWSPNGARRVGMFGGETRVGLEESFEISLDPDAPYRPPVAVDDSFEVPAERASLLDVLANDTEPEGGRAAPEIVEGPQNGTARVDELHILYTPRPGYVGPDLLRYRIGDGFSESTALVRIDVRGGANALPVARDDAFASGPGGVSVPAPGVLENDTDPEGAPLTAVLVSPPANGNAVLDADGSFEYAPQAGFSGTDSFTYQASDGSLASNVATVTITVETANRPPLAGADHYELEGDELVVPAPGVLGNDSDPEGGNLEARLVTSPRHGTLELRPDGSFRYRAEAGFPGFDVFTYAAFDGAHESTAATVRIHRASACDALYGIDVVSDSLVQIDPASGRGQLVGPLGIAVSSAALAFGPNGDLWGLSMREGESDGMVLYRVDSGTGAARVVHELDLSADPRPLAGTGGLAFSGDGRRLYWLSGSFLSVVDVETGRLEAFPSNDPLPLSGSSLTLPASCHDLVAGDDASGRLVRISAFDGAVEDIGPTGLAGIGSLAAASDATVFGESNGRLHRLDLAGGGAVEVGELDFDVTGLAFRPPFARSLCLDAKLDRRTGLSRWVTGKKGAVRHVDRCPKDDDERCEKHGRRDCSSCPRATCGKCGDQGFYRLGEGGKLIVRTPELPAAGRYRVRVQLRARGDKARVRIRSGSERVSFVVTEDEWHWTEWALLELEKGVSSIELSANGRVDVEKVRIEQDCPKPCRGEAKGACLDRRLGRGGLSSYVVEIEGRAGHVGRDGCCGSSGHYFVAGGDTAHAGRIVGEIDLPRSGRYEMRFQYKRRGHADESELLDVSLGGRRFRFRGKDLPASDEWRWSRAVEVELSAGRQRIEFLSTGGRRVELERLRFEHLCACVGTKE